MTFASGAVALHGSIRRKLAGRGAGVRALALVGACAMALPGCAVVPGSRAAVPAAPVAAVRAPSDPVVAFAAVARPGAETVIALPDSGRSARVRVLRAYHAASGRECRELLLGAGADERSRTVCETDGQWADARPLLRGGGLQRP